MYPSPVIGFPSRFGQKIQIKLVRKKKLKKVWYFSTNINKKDI